MSSPSDKIITVDRVEQFLIEHGLDPRRARAVHALLEKPSEPLPSAVGSHEAGTRAVPTVPLRSPAAIVEATMLLAGGAPSDARPAASTELAHRPVLSERPASRFVPGALLGAGGMGEVYRVRDDSLHRHLAMKVLNEELTKQADVRARFLQEAQVTAQLAHPGIPPVHEIGELPSGRPYFTMKEVHGTTLAHVIEEAHRDPVGGARWSEQRLLEVFQKVCEAVAYAHSRGVAHCDLKPHNVMVGAFGEVLVMDWGAARLADHVPVTSADEPPVVTDARQITDSLVAGTPAYMSPEHAGAAVERIGPPADVYALGVMLFELLAGERPYKGTRTELISLATSGEVPPLPKRPGSAADDSLYAIIVRAMRPDLRDRYANAKEMAGELARWREGAIRREKALAMVREAEHLLTPPNDGSGTLGIEEKLEQSVEQRRHAGRELARLGADAAADEKEPAWALQDAADGMAHEAILGLVEVEQRLQNALALAPELVEAKSLIARMRYARCMDSIQRRAWDEAARHELVLRAHDVGEFRDWLDGTAPLVVAIDTPCRVRLHRFEVQARRLLSAFERELVETRLVEERLPVGSYLLELLAADRPPVRYPVVLGRRSGWLGRRPGMTAPCPVEIPAASTLAPGDIWIGSGCCEIGGDEQAPGAFPATRVWVDGFVIREYPVTFAELALFLADADGMPFSRAVFRDGLQIWRPDWPAVGVSWDAACAYAAWWAKRTGLPWRLPTEIEWEKAARGVDGRFYPWGDFTDPALCHSRSVERSPRSPAPISSYLTDCSPYGVRGFGGNVREWCADAATLTGPWVDQGIASRPPLCAGASDRMVRGGSFRQPPEAARVAARTSLAAGQGYPDVGFRLVRMP